VAQAVDYELATASLLPAIEDPFQLGALTALLGIVTALNEVDESLHRERIVRVLQTKDEGGMKLFMESETINGLAEGGRTAVPS
jgi:hypothetical protein